MNPPNQLPLLVEDLPTAIRAVIQAMGGSKRAGAMLRPELPADDAGRWLRDCLDDQRREKLSLEQFLLLLVEGRRVGCHVAMAYLAEQAGYAPPQPVEPADEAAELQREFIAAVARLGTIERRLGALGRAELARVA